MGFSRRFDVGLAWRIGLLIIALGVLIGTLTMPGLGAARIVSCGIAGFALATLWHHIRRTNMELARFVDAVRFGDFSQRFDTADQPGGFDLLGQSFDRALRSLHDRQLASAAELRFLSAAIDDAPVALFTIDPDGNIRLLSKAARRLFQRDPPTRIEDFERFGSELLATLQLPPGQRRVTRLVRDSVTEQVIVTTARLDRLDGAMTIGSILTVQREFGAIEMAAQAGLVRVLTHEIMNSLTPVTSLARSSAGLLARVAGDNADLADARQAVETTADRAEGILKFVASYRDFATSPDVKRRPFAADPWAQGIAQLAAVDPKAGTMALAVLVEPAGVTIDGDESLLTQVVLNLIRNAALAGATKGELRIRSRHGSALRIEVADNGPGIAPDRRQDVFLPFYTTRKEGSGVGLSFARQVALAHGGTITAGESDLGGASILIAL